jgi:hypothetical protein
MIEHLKRYARLLELVKRYSPQLFPACVATGKGRLPSRQFAGTRLAAVKQAADEGGLTGVLQVVR